MQERSPHSLALEMGADLVLMDETEGRAVATSLQLATMGLLGVLLQARQLGLIPAVAPLLESLQQEARFWIAPSLREAVLRAAGENL
jgi:predicted nucleic acid-binding protein